MCRYNYISIICCFKQFTGTSKCLDHTSFLVPKVLCELTQGDLTQFFSTFSNFFSSKNVNYNQRSTFIVYFCPLLIPYFCDTIYKLCSKVSLVEQSTIECVLLSYSVHALGIFSRTKYQHCLFRTYMLFRIQICNLFT